MKPLAPLFRKQIEQATLKTVFFFLGLVLMFPAHSQSAEQRPFVLRINGPITGTTQRHVLGQLNQQPTHSDILPAGLIVLLNSAGGDGEAAMAIGRALRQHQAHVFAVGRCDSACVFILAGGVVRAGLPAALGVHAGRLTQTDAQGRITREIDARQSLDDSYRLTDFNSQVRRYLNEMGIGQGLLDVMLTHQTKSVYRLSPHEIASFRLYGFDAEYLNSYTTFYNKTYESLPINQSTLTTRTLSVPIKCRREMGTDAAFVLCYQHVIQNHSAP